MVRRGNSVNGGVRRAGKVGLCVFMTFISRWRCVGHGADVLGSGVCRCVSCVGGEGARGEILEGDGN